MDSAGVRRIGSAMTSRMYGYVRARQLEGTYSDDPSIGNWGISAMRIARGWGSPTEAEWPYDGSAKNWPPKEPVQIDQAAKACRMGAYQRVRTIDDCKRAIAQKRPVMVSFEIALADWRSAPNGHIPMPDSRTRLAASHSVQIVGYDDTRENFVVRNSWGTTWGDQGYGYLPYPYFDPHLLEAWAVPVGGERLILSTAAGIVERGWGIPDCFASTPLHGFEFFDAGRDECIGWAFVVKRNGFADIEELFVRPSYRGKGYGRHLAKLILASPHISGCPLRLWISHADRQEVGTPPVAKTLRRLGLSAKSSSPKWAAYVAT
jgi:GNAT superfamily N-acetyltransferase